MNANLMKYIGPLTFVELGFVGFFRKKVAGTKSRENMLSIVSCTVFIVNMAFLLLNPLLSKHVQTV